MWPKRRSQKSNVRQRILDSFLHNRFISLHPFVHHLKPVFSGAQPSIPAISIVSIPFSNRIPLTPFASPFAPAHQISPLSTIFSLPSLTNQTQPPSTSQNHHHPPTHRHLRLPHLHHPSRFRLLLPLRCQYPLEHHSPIFGSYIPAHDPQPPDRGDGCVGKGLWGEECCVDWVHLQDCFQ